MATIVFPNVLIELLNGSPFAHSIRRFADAAAEILAANDMCFFPAYTDHGLDHVNRVLQAQVRLIPEDVLEQAGASLRPRLLSAADAVVMIGATILHDFAMHINVAGFLELIQPNSRFAPIPWFASNRHGHRTDRPWHVIWQDYLREASRFSDQVQFAILGENSVRNGWRFRGLPRDQGDWSHNDRLVVGEFLRRHHARLAHEMAHYGFPGLEAGDDQSQFPAMGDKSHPLSELADLIGLTARSHGMSLRLCQAYLKESPRYGKTPRPNGTSVLYLMALLRIADYFQIDRQRAPAVLLQLRDPQSPVSLGEWQKHQVVLSIDPADDPRGINVTINHRLSLEVYLQLRALLEDLQAELDHSTAVLDEAYGTRSDLGMDRLALAIRRVHSNLTDPAFSESLPYVADRTGLTADPNLVTLLVEPLYGKYPNVAIRELMQNAIDAVRELHVWCATNGAEISTIGSAQQTPDVLIELIERQEGPWIFRITDKGIGMSADTVQHYFLRAGASFRRSETWMDEFTDEQGQPRVLRSGRFGIGVFAAFLLGPTIKVWTQHVSDSDHGHFVKLTEGVDLARIDKITSLNVGTIVEVEVSSSVARVLTAEEWDWFCWDWPKVEMHIVRTGQRNERPQRYKLPVSRLSKLPPDWSMVTPTGFDAILWDFEQSPPLVCNGLRIARSKFDEYEREAFEWPYKEFQRPRIGVVDSRGNLPVTIQRYELTDRRLPFTDELIRDVHLSFIAHAIVCGPQEPTSMIASGPYCHFHPLVKVRRDDTFTDSYDRLNNVSLRWSSSATGFVPVESWLHSLHGHDTYVVYGVITTYQSNRDHCITRWPLVARHAPLQPVICWDSSASAHYMYSGNCFDEDAVRMFMQNVTMGLQILGHEIQGSRFVTSFRSRTPVRTEVTTGARKFWLPWRARKRESHTANQFQFKKAAWESGSPSRATDIDGLLGMFQANSITHGDEGYKYFYVAELTAKPSPRKPESLLARLWNECFADNVIPFDPKARNALIARGREHADLRRHIDAWEEMKRANSRWTQTAQREAPHPAYSRES